MASSFDGGGGTGPTVEDVESSNGYVNHATMSCTGVSTFLGSSNGPGQSSQPKIQIPPHANYLASASQNPVQHQHFYRLNAHSHILPHASTTAAVAGGGGRLRRATSLNHEGADSGHNTGDITFGGADGHNHYCDIVINPPGVVVKTDHLDHATGATIPTFVTPNLTSIQHMEGGGRMNSSAIHLQNGPTTRLVGAGAGGKSINSAGGATNGRPVTALGAGHRGLLLTNHDSKKPPHWKSRLLINLVAGIIVMVGISIALFLFVVVPQMNAAPRPSNTIGQQNRFPGNREHRYDWPAASYSLLGKFAKAAITCDHGLCSEIGRDVMLRGGNAVDASIASLFCLGVTNPQSSGLGGGFIMTAYNATTRQCKVLDARETAPRAATRDMYGNDEWASKYGYRAIAVPGELAGYWLAYKEWGSGKVPWRDLVMPSVELARQGVPISEYLGHVLAVKEKHFRSLPSMQSWISNETNSVWRFGDVIQRSELAATMERIALADDPVELFYHGDMADTIVAEIQTHGGLLTKEDLAGYKPKIYERPLTVDGFFQDQRMCGPPAIITVMVMRFSDHVREANAMSRATLLDDTSFYHWLIEAQKFAYAQRANLGDVDFVPEALQLAANMTTQEWARRVLKSIPPHAMFSTYYEDAGVTKRAAQKEDHGTSHVSVIDSAGNGVSATSTVNRWFGAVVQSETLGIVWNDEMDDFSTPGMSNGFGFAPSERNFIEPGKRPMSSMSPMVMYDIRTGKLKFVIGASGGSKIISALAKPIIRVLCYNETIKQAIDAPTLHNQFTPDVTQYEELVPRQLLTDLEEKFQQKFKPTTGFEGIVQAVYVNHDDVLHANGDYRRRSQMHPEGF